MTVTIRRAVLTVCGALLTALSCGREAPPPDSVVHTLNSGCLRPTGASTPALEPDDAWLGGVTAAGDTVHLMVTRDAEIRAFARPLFPLTLEFRSETLADTERYTRMELGWGPADLKYVEVPKAPTTHQVAIPRTLLGQQEATLRVHATSTRPGRKHTMRGYLLLSETSAFWGPLWGTDACSETLIVSENEELTVFLPASQRQWLGFDAHAHDGGGRLRVDVLSDVGDRISLGTTAVGTAPEFGWEGWEWSHPKSERQRVTFVPEDGTVSITLRKAVFDPPIDKVVWSARRILRAGVRRPPIVVVLLDAFRSDRWGARNGGRSVTPHLDELAKRGVLFRNARCHVPYTRGSMPTILTGCYPPEETGIRRKLRHDTLASVLQDAGYATVAVSSNPFLRPGTELDVGFDLVIDVDAWLRNRATEGSRYWAQQALDPLIETLFILGDQPFLIFLHLMQPHGPYCPPAPYDTLYTVSDPGRLRDLEPLGPERLQDLAWNVTDEESAYLRERYDGNVSYADHVVGLILEVLETFGPEREPILVVLSDHGEALMSMASRGIHTDSYTRSPSQCRYCSADPVCLAVWSSPRP